MLEKFKNLPQGVKASVAFFIASLVTKGIAYITTPLFTRLLTTTEYGQVSLYLTWENIFGILAMFCLMNGVFNNGMVDYPDERNNYSFSMLILSNIITFIFGVVMIVVYPHIKKLIKIDPVLIALMFVVFLFQPAYSFWTAKQRYELKYKASVFWSILAAIVSPLIGILSIIFFDGDNVHKRLFGSELSLVAIYLGFYIYLAVKNKFRIDTRFWKPAILFNLPLIPHYLSSLLLSSSDRVMISYLVNDEATAYYSVAYSVAAVASIVWTAINASLVPFTYENCKKESYDRINKITLPIITFFAVICLVVIMLAPEVILVMATENYMAAIYVIPPIVGGVFFQVQYYIYANIVYYYKKPIFVMISSVCATFMNIALNYLFIPKFGYIAAGYTTLACYLLQAVIDYFAMKHVINKRIYNMKYITVLSTIVIIVSIGSVYLYDYWFLRYAVLLLVVLMAIRNKNTILGLVSEIRKR